MPDVDITFITKGLEKAESDIKQLTQATRSLGDTAKKSSSKAEAGFSKMKSGMSSLGNTTSKGSTSMKGALSGVVATVGDVINAFKGAADIVGNFFESYTSQQQAVDAMAKQFGVSANEVVSTLKRVSGGTISAKNLVLTANKAMALGVTTDMKQLAIMLDFARRKARVMGTTTEKAFDDLATGIARGSVQILDNLGLNVKAWKENAEAAGQVIDGQFIFNQVMKEANQLISEQGELALTDAEKMQVLSASTEDVNAEFGKALFDVFSPFIFALTELLKIIGSAPPFFKGLVAAMIPLIGVTAGLVALIPGLNIATAAAVAGAAAITTGIVAQVKATQKEADELNVELNKVDKKVDVITRKPRRKIHIGLSKSKSLQQFLDEEMMTDVDKAVKSITEKFKDMAENITKPVKRSFSGAKREINNVIEGLGKMPQIDANKVFGMGDALKYLEQFGGDVVKAKEKYFELLKVAEKHGLITEQQRKAYKKEANSLYLDELIPKMAKTALEIRKKAYKEEGKLRRQNIEDEKKYNKKLESLNTVYYSKLEKEIEKFYGKRLTLAYTDEENELATLESTKEEQIKQAKDTRDILIRLYKERITDTEEFEKKKAEITKQYGELINKIEVGAEKGSSEIKEKYRKQDLSKQYETRQRQIDIMAEGADKRLAQLDLNMRRELLDVEKGSEDELLIRQKYEKLKNKAVEEGTKARIDTLQEEIQSMMGITSSFLAQVGQLASATGDFLSAGVSAEIANLQKQLEDAEKQREENFERLQQLNEEWYNNQIALIDAETEAKLNALAEQYDVEKEYKEALKELDEQEHERKMEIMERELDELKFQRNYDLNEYERAELEKSIIDKQRAIARAELEYEGAKITEEAEAAKATIKESYTTKSDDLDKEIAEGKSEREKELIKQIYQAELAQFNMEKEFRTAQSYIDLASGLIGIWTTNFNNPILAGILSALLGGTVAAQIATIESQNPPAVPALAEGGIVSSPTLAMIGEGRQSEAVVPLSDEAKEIINNGIIGAANDNMNITLKLDMDLFEFGEKLLNVQRKRSGFGG